MAICLAAVGGAATILAVNAFTLAWTHSIEKVRWEEDYRVERSASRSRLRLVEARIRGSGAGMEPPADARLADGVWHYVPALPLLSELRLTESGFAADYALCTAAGCRALKSLVPTSGPIAVIELRPCGDSRDDPMIDKASAARRSANGGNNGGRRNWRPGLAPIGRVAFDDAPASIGGCGGDCWG